MRGVGWRSPFVLFLAILLYSGTSYFAEDDYVGSEECGACHEEVVADFQKTGHAKAPGWKKEEGCESCHGPGTAHIEGDGDLAKIIRPQTLPPREASESCLSCHSRHEKQFTFGQGIHSLSEISCIDCHSPHTTTEKMLKKTGAELCATCHQGIVAQFQLPRSHPLAEADKGCVNCHQPHGTKNWRMSAGFGNQACAQCHFEKTGPFLYSHDVGMMDGCQSCHEVHGTPNRHLLKHSRAINLCYQCHTASQTPGFHSALTYVNEKCTACHTAIHGSNTNPFFLEE